ncbi:MAG: HAMP domain-containing histidine kinase [Dehalococcoidia bacterium]|nr:MAG: HAMP domain-containing histidine kinase [Dehalococcoidia bacterium]
MIKEKQLEKILRLYKDPYPWVILSGLSVVLAMIYWIEDIFLDSTSSELETYGTHLILIVVRSGILLVIVGIASWRFNFKGGLVICLITGIFMLPHILDTMAEPLGTSTLSVYFIGAISGIAFSLLVGTRKQIQSELEEHRNKLEQQVKKRTEELNTSIERRIDFTRELVHELKTPLTAIISSSELLTTTELDDLEKESQVKLAKNIYRGARNLDKRIDELLDVAKSEIGILKLTYSLFDPLTLINDVAEDMVITASSKSQELVLEAPQHMQYIWADRYRLEQILYNIINNAIKFNRKEGKIIFRVMKHNRYLLFEVQDEGKGIPRGDLEKLFVPYYRLERDRERLGGLGLGLTLCKELVELHEGKIWVKSE